MKAGRLVFWTAAFVLALIGAAWIWRTYSGGYRRFFEIAAGIPRGLWPTVLLATAVYHALDWIRFYVLLRVFGKRLSLLSGLKLTLIADFVCALTPVTELHLPAMVYFLGREGVPHATGAAVTLTKSMTMTAWVCLLAGLALQLGGGARLPHQVTQVLPVSLLCVAVLTLPLIALAFFPRPLLDWCTRRLERPGLGAWKRKALEALRDTAASLAAIGGAAGRGLVWVNAAAIGSVAAYVALGMLLAWGVGLDPGWRRGSAAFAAGLMVAYLAPVPGSFGVTEWATSYLLDPAMTQEGMAVSILLRTLVSYAGIPLGAGIVAFEAWRRGTVAFADDGK
ncbi:MAG: flippase-like domain-containing protein [Elusimicrobia bacterium]|nr:flippase-like domain-containing protein [Elusimicrobiota bacterium]